MKSPRLLLALALTLMLLGIIFPFLMVIHVIPSSFFLNFLSWGSTIVGWALGMIAVASMVDFRK
ncbi:MAG: hypothetical protein H7Y59_20235 [Anaerolineales bacterium]|nr:hypothetical protein [Anaerolineales bacterium]